MKNYKEIFDSIESISKENGASNVKIIKVEQIEFNPIFRDMCIANHCGMYNKCYMCPPSIGKVEKLVEIIKKYKFAAVFQTITTLEDSYDFEGMLSAKKTIFSIIEGLRELCEKLNLDDVMLFGPGGCGVCEKCAKEIIDFIEFKI